jgi:hypothetical protein
MTLERSHEVVKIQVVVVADATHEELAIHAYLHAGGCALLA